MARRQTRRSISLKWSTYQRFQKMCAEDGRSMSGYLEDKLNAEMDRRGRPIELVREPRPNGTKHVNPPTAGGVFSW